MSSRLRKNRYDGFTLLEVLGAVAILGISYMVLATAAIQAMQGIGQSQRRLEASLIADQTLIDVEISTETGQLVEPKLVTWQDSHFEVTLEIIDLSEIHQGKGLQGDGTSLLEFLGKESKGAFAPFRESNLLLGYLREVHITVQWLEGGNELYVTRTAFIYDQQGWIENEQEAGQAPPDEGVGSDSLTNGDIPQDIQDQLLRGAQ
jgi:prepilin-type N-terminal cleavage/methylation domain-containing protein